MCNVDVLQFMQGILPGPLQAPHVAHRHARTDTLRHGCHMQRCTLFCCTPRMHQGSAARGTVRLLLGEEA